MSHYGIDIASFQWPIDYGAVVNELRQLGGGSVPFVIVKATESNNYINPYFAAQINGFKSAGAVVGTYLFDHGSTVPGQENALYLSVAGNLPAVLDIEDPQGMSPSQYASHIQQVLNLEPQDMAYLNGSEMATMPGAPWGHLLWLADYNNQPGVVSYACTIHQYNDKGQINGIKGLVDLDVWLGDETGFENFFHMAPVVHPPVPVVPTPVNPNPVNPDAIVGACANTNGYTLASASGGIFNYGTSFYGSLGSNKLAAPIVDVSMTSTGNGYIMAGSDGGVFCFGDASYHNSVAGDKLSAPVAGICLTSTNQGYWMIGADGGVFCFGDAQFHGSLGGTKLNAPIVKIISSNDGGYILIAKDGGVFCFGNANFAGSLGSIKLAAPIVSAAAGKNGGYWLVGSDGGVFCFGVPYFGSLGNIKLTAPIVDINATPTGYGYWLYGADGGVFTFGDSTFHGAK